MKSIQERTKSRYDKFKTLCTLDSSDIILNSDIKQIINQSKNYPTTTKSKHFNKQKTKNQTKYHNRHSISLTHKSTIQQHTSTFKQLKPRQKSHKNNKNSLISGEKYLKHKTINTQNYYRSIALSQKQSQIHTKTINSEWSPNQKLKSKTKLRIKTQHHQIPPNLQLLNNLQIFTNLKNVKFHMDQKFNVDPFHLIKTIKSTPEQTIQTVKKLNKNYTSSLYTLKKSNHPKVIEKYQRQINIKQQLTDRIPPNQKRNLSTIHKVYKKDNQSNMLLLYELEGQPLSWKKTLSKRLIHNLPKNDMQILKHLIVQISKAIHILSSYGYYHSLMTLKSILLELKQDDENVKVSKLVKLGNLGLCQQIKDKKSFIGMSFSISTPPEILNFIMFENQNRNFNREWLQYIYRYEDGWKINVWSLGILILELLNQEPFQFNFTTAQQIIQFQKHMELKCSYLFEKVTDHELYTLLKKMLSINPEQRPSPQQIILSLTK